MAGGLHKKVESHAKPIAHMALKMMELSEEVLTPDGKPIKVTPDESLVSKLSKYTKLYDIVPLSPLPYPTCCSWRVAV